MTKAKKKGNKVPKTGRAGGGAGGVEKETGSGERVGRKWFPQTNRKRGREWADVQANRQFAEKVRGKGGRNFHWTQGVYNSAKQRGGGGGTWKKNKRNGAQGKFNLGKSCCNWLGETG